MSWLLHEKDRQAHAARAVLSQKKETLPSGKIVTAVPLARASILVDRGQTVLTARVW